MPRYSSSGSWKLERAQNELRMRNSQARFWRPVIVWVWFIGSGAYLWISIGAHGRNNFWPWLSALIWGWLWPTHRVAYQGNWHNPQILSDWFQQNIYGNSLSSWLFESLLAGAIPAVIGVMGLVWFSYRQSQTQTTEEHLRGVRMVTNEELENDMAGPRSWWQQQRKGDGIQVAGITFSRTLETRHVAVTGSTGTGKSTILRGLLRQIAKRGETAIVLDPESELTPEFYDPLSNDILLNPTDARCPYWSPWLELAEVGDAQALATSVIPDPPERGSGNEMYFVNSARELFVTLLEQLPKHDPQELSRILFGPLPDLLALIANTPAASHVVADAPDQRGGVISTLQIALKGFRFLPPESKQTWSAKAWQEKRRGWLFMPCRESDRAAVLSLQSVWLDTLIRRLLDTDLARDERVWIVIDEVATLRRLQHLEDILTRGRKRGVSIVIGFQAVPQLRRLYGHDATATMLAAPAVKVFLGTGEPETAQWCSQAIGTRDVRRPIESETAGPVDMRDSFSVSYQEKTEPLVLASQFQQLPPLTGYLSVAGHNVTAVTFPVIESKPRQPGFVSRLVSSPPLPPPVVPSVAPSPPPVQPAKQAPGQKRKL